MGTAMADHILIEAESFANKGGWKLDQQFVHLMGSPYLLAHGLGKPVDNAQTTATVRTAGDHRLWVRTKDWVPGPWDPPGRFRAIIDGTPAETVFGTGETWGWEDGGTIELPTGDISVELKDLTGFDGRCDALLLTTDLGFQPPDDPAALRDWRNALHGRPATPESAGTFDVVIVGGGISGCAAAIAAGQQGLKVALVHDRPVLGGNASGEIRVHTEGIHAKGEDIIKRIDTDHWPNGSAEALKDDRKRRTAMDALDTVQIFRSWRAYGVTTEGARIQTVNAQHIETGRTISVTAPVFIDCTGDGWIGFWAGAEFRYGREGRNEFGEDWPKWGQLWSPKEPDNRVMGASLLWYSREVDVPSTFPEVPWALPVAGKHAALKGEWFWEYSSNDKHAIDDAEEIRDHMLRAIYGSFANAKQNARNSTRELDWVGYLSGKRESRRLIGDHIYTMKDAVEQRYFPDTVVSETRAIDVHYQRKLKADAGPDTPDFLSTALFLPVGRYYIPFRSLYSKNVENLMMAGRCFSCSHVGLGGPRVMLTCGQMGIATGYAAALCRKHKATPRAVGADHIAELRELVGETDSPPEGVIERTTRGKYRIETLPERLVGLPRITVARGNTQAAGTAFSFTVTAPARIYIAVHKRGDYTPPESWQKTDMTTTWSPQHGDAIYQRDVPPGRVEVPAHAGKQGVHFGLPHVVFVAPSADSTGAPEITDLPMEHAARLQE
jgi:hypothetical protein